MWVAELISPEHLHHLFATYGIWTVALIVGLESLGVPLPGETILIIASLYAADHDGNIIAVIAAATVGAVVGDNLGYLIGREFGYQLALKFGSYVGLTESRIKLGQYLYGLYGGRVVFFGRFFAVLRFLAAFLAGVNQMAWQRFLVANALGGLLWASMVGFSAYALGRSIHQVQGPAGAVGIALALATIVAAFVYLRRHEAELCRKAEEELPGPITGYENHGVP